MMKWIIFLLLLVLFKALLPKVKHKPKISTQNSNTIKLKTSITQPISPIIVVANSCVKSTKLGDVLRELLLAHNVSLHPYLKEWRWDWEIYTNKNSGILHAFKQTLNESRLAYNVQKVMQAHPRGIFKLDSKSFKLWKQTFPETHKNARIVKVERCNKLLKHICHYSDCFWWYFPDNINEIAMNVFENGAPSDMCWERRTSKTKQYLKIKDMDKFESVFKEKELSGSFEHDFFTEDLLSFYLSKDDMNLSLNKWSELFSMINITFDNNTGRTMMNKYVGTYQPNTVQSKLTPKSFYEISKRPLFEEYIGNTLTQRTPSNNRMIQMNGKRLIFCIAGKTASTSFYTMLYKSLYNQSYPVECMKQKKWVQSMQCGWHNAQIYDTERTSNFTVVRNPVQRAISGWSSKIAPNQCMWSVDTYDREGILRNISQPTVGLKLYPWLKVLMGRSKVQMDTHFIPISDFCGDTEHIIKLENIGSHTFSKYLKNIGGSLQPFPKSHPSEGRLFAPENSSSNIYHDALDMIYAFYARDFEAYNYTKNPEEDLQYIKSKVSQACLF